MHSLPSTFPAALRGIESLVLPMACLSCERALGARSTGPLCEQCRLELRAIAPPRCKRCGQTKDRWDSGVVGQAATPLTHSPTTCGFCHDWPEALSWAASAVWFDEGPARQLVYALKYGGWRIAAGPMAAAMHRYLAAPLEQGAVLVPIPLGVRRRRERGHNQAEVLAHALTAEGRVLRTDLLERTRETRTQTSLHPDERERNVRGAFRASAAAIGSRVILVDDVLTTGATLAAAAVALCAAGAASVGAVTFARAAKPGDVTTS